MVRSGMSTAGEGEDARRRRTGDILRDSCQEGHPRTGITQKKDTLTVGGMVKEERGEGIVGPGKVGSAKSGASIGEALLATLLIPTTWFESGKRQGIRVTPE